MFVDQVIHEFDVALQSVSGVTRGDRASPADAFQSVDLSAEQRREVIGLMRVDHVGEVCAQALYQAQALATRNSALAERFRLAAREERDHLAWTSQRLEALGGRPSVLNPIWYLGAFAIGAVAGRAGDAISLGFMAETERQVEQHLNGHLDRLPAEDEQSRAILDQMKADEIAHAESASAMGGVPLPLPVRWLMRGMAKIMTTTASRI